MSEYFTSPTKYIYIIYLEYHTTELGPAHPHSLGSESVLPEPGGGAQSLAAKGVGGPNSDNWRKSLVLYLLYAPVYIFQKCTEYFLLSLNLSFHLNVRVIRR
jgi:hypothetical protein